MIFLFAGILLSMFSKAQAETVPISPGETGNLTLAVQNDAASPAQIQQVLVTLSGAPSYFHAPASIGPYNISASEIKNFVFPYFIDSTAADGQFQIQLTITPQTTNFTPISPDTPWDSKVDFIIHCLLYCQPATSNLVHTSLDISSASNTPQHAGRAHYSA